MILLNIPAPQVPPLSFFSVNAVLDGVNYTLEFRWNTYDSRWYVRILDEMGQTILAGDCRVSADTPIYASSTQRTPPGFLYPFDSSGQALDPGLSDLGARVQLWYITAAEVAAA